MKMGVTIGGVVSGLDLLRSEPVVFIGSGNMYFDTVFDLIT